ncbi:MAG: DUF2849 domain-containing protein [Methylocella sp.]
MTKVVSANRLTDGVVVYLGRDGSWVRSLDDARLFVSSVEEQAGLEAAEKDAKRNLVVEPFVVEVIAGEGGVDAVSLRDKIRAHGPTINYTDGGTRAGAERS